MLNKQTVSHQPSQQHTIVSKIFTHRQISLPISILICDVNSNFMSSTMLIFSDPSVCSHLCFWWFHCCLPMWFFL